MSTDNSKPAAAHTIVARLTVVAFCFCCWSGAMAQPLVPGQVTEIPFTQDDLPRSLYSVSQGKPSPSCMSVRLPDDYRATGVYPLLVYLHGLDATYGGRCGNIEVAQEIAGKRGWITASLPLFKRSVDTNEYRNPWLVSFADYPAISKAYGVMLGKLFELVPNIDPKRSGMVGFSNGAITIAVLVSLGDEFLLTHFRSFVLVDHGMYHLGDFGRRRLQDCRFLLLVGGRLENEGPGRRIMLQQAALIADRAKLLDVNLRCVQMEDTGHDFPSRYRDFAGRWLRGENVVDAAPGNAAKLFQ